MEPTTTGDGSTLRDWRHLPMPVWLWTPIALGPALWLLYLSPHAPVGIPHFDWGLYTADATHWFTTGTPYVVPPGIYGRVLRPL